MSTPQLTPNRIVSLDDQSTLPGEFTLKQRLVRTFTAMALALAATIVAMTGVVAPASAADAPGLPDQLTLRTVSASPGMVSGDPAPVLSVTPAAFGFGPINVGGELGEPAEFTLSNPGTEVVQLDDAVIEGDDAGSFKILPNGSSCYFMEPTGFLLPGASCTLVAIFDPESEGPKQANLRIISNSLTSPEVLPLTGTGLQAFVPGATVSPQSLEFGSHRTGTRSEPKAITLTSTGTGDVRIENPVVLGDAADQFQVTSNTCSNRSMASGDSCQVLVVFAPDGAGNSTATLTLPTDADGADTTVELDGTGTVPPPPAESSRVLTGNNIPRLRDSELQTIPVRCYTTNMDWCRGRITLQARGRALGLHHNRLVGIGSLAYTLKDGSRTVLVRIGDRARNQIRRNGRLQVRVVTTSRQGDGSFRTANAVRQLRR